jgi:hypothetical protein
MPQPEREEEGLKSILHSARVPSVGVVTSYMYTAKVRGKMPHEAGH